MNSNMIVWRESIYKNNFKCTQCGRKLADKNGQPTEKLIYDKDNTDRQRAICTCGYPVADVQLQVPDLEPPENEDYAFRGNLEDYLEKERKRIRKELEAEVNKKIYDQFYERLDKLGQMIKDLTRSNEQIKKDKDKIIKQKQETISQLNKEILKLEHRLVEMERGGLIHDNDIQEEGMQHDQNTGS